MSEPKFVPTTVYVTYIASTPEKVVRLKPQNLVIGLPMPQREVPT